jgi:hypothetical protein
LVTTEYLGLTINLKLKTKAGSQLVVELLVGRQSVQVFEVDDLLFFFTQVIAGIAAKLVQLV